MKVTSEEATFTDKYDMLRVQTSRKNHNEKDGGIQVSTERSSVCKIRNGEICRCSALLYEELGTQKDLICRDGSDPKLFHILALCSAEQIERRSSSQRISLHGIDVAHHPVHIILRQRIERGSLREVLADILVIFLEPSFLLGSPGITVE